MNNSKCAECTESTKAPIGFWDARDPITDQKTSGMIFDCKSVTCPIKQEQIKLAAQSEAERDSVKSENESNGINAQEFHNMRRSSGLTIRHCADVVSVSCVDYSHWEHERKAIPRTVYDFISGYFKGHPKFTFKPERPSHEEIGYEESRGVMEDRW